MSKSLSILIGLLLSIITTANAQTENPDFMRSTGKIYVVIAVLCVIFIGIVLFLINLDRKIARLENEVKNSW